MRYRALTVLAAAAAMWVPPAGSPAAAADEAAPDAGLYLARPAPAPADGSAAGANRPAGVAQPIPPVWMSMLQDVESIYPTPMPAREEEFGNKGNVNLSLRVNYLTDYVYRGIDRSEVGGAEDAPNLQFDSKLSFNLGRFPHPFVGLFVNVYNDDPISRFQEVRPIVGLDWEIRPITISAGYVSYIFPEREDQNTNEAFLQVALDDSLLLNRDHPLLSPYVYAAYDFDKFDGVYLEAGVKHDFIIEDTPLVLTAVADVGYVINNRQFSRFPDAVNRDDIGFQHYEVGLISTYSLNTLLNIPRRYGEFKAKGYLYYTDGIENGLKADSEVWGGVGIQFDY